MTELGFAQDIYILSWNVGNFYIPPSFWPFDVLNRSLLKNGSSRKHTPKIREVIEHFSPQVVLLQEVDGEGQLEELTKETEYFGTLGPAYNFRDYSGNLAVLTKTPLEKVVSLPNQHAMVVQSGEGLTLANVHLDTYNRSRRTAQLDEIVRCVPAERTIIAGDFNDSPRGMSFNSEKFKHISKNSSTSIYLKALDHVLATHDLNMRVDKVDARFGWMDHYPLLIGPLNGENGIDERKLCLRDRILCALPYVKPVVEGILQIQLGDIGVKSSLSAAREVMEVRSLLASNYGNVSGGLISEYLRMVQMEIFQPFIAVAGRKNIYYSLNPLVDRSCSTIQIEHVVAHELAHIGHARILGRDFLAPSENDGIVEGFAEYVARNVIESLYWPGCRAFDIGAWQEEYSLFMKELEVRGLEGDREVVDFVRGFRDGVTIL